MTTKSLTHDQLAYVKSYGRSKSPRAIARELKVDVRTIQDALKKIDEPAPATAPAATAAAASETQVAARPRLARPGWLPWAIALVVVLAGWFAYSNNLADGWHFDDTHSITGNGAIQHPTFRGIYQNNVYRQVLYWSFALSWHLHGPSTWGWHVENDAIHLLNALLVYALVLLTLRSPGARGATRWPYLVAGLAAALFAVHPLQTQAVTYITQRTESLAATFYLLALILYALARLRRVEGRASGENLAGLPIAGGVTVVLLGAGLVVWRPTDLLAVFLAILGLTFAGTVGALAWLVAKKRTDLPETVLLAGALIATFFGLETKEIAGTIPGAILLWELLFARPRGTPRLVGKTWREKLRPYMATAPWVAMLIVLPWLAVRAGLSVHFLAAENSEEHAPGFAISGPEYFFTQLNVLATYVRLFLLPYNQTLDYDYPKASSLFALPTLISAVFVAGLVGVAIKSIRRRPLIAWGILFGLGVLLPTSSVFVLPDFIYEHRMYLPLAGAALIAALLLERVVRLAVEDEAVARKAFVAAAVPVLVACVFLTRARNEVWATEETLWKDCIAKAPKKPRPKTNLGLYYQNNEPWMIFTKGGQSIGGEILDGDTHNRPGLWLVRPTLDERHQTYVVNKSDVLRGPVEWGGTARAEKLYDDAIAIDKYYYKARNNYALCEVQDGMAQLQKSVELKQAAQKLREANGAEIDIEKLETRAHDCAAEATTHFERGAEHLRTIIESRPRDYVAMSNLANLYFSYLDRLDDAMTWMEKSIATNDTQPIVYAVLGEMYYTRACELSTKGDDAGAMPWIRKAIAVYQQFLERASDDPNADHIRYRLRLSEVGLKTGGHLVEPEGDQKVPSFRGSVGANAMRGTRFKPVHQGPRPQSPGN